jgi:hypothetical protein
MKGKTELLTNLGSAMLCGTSDDIECGMWNEKMWGDI